MRPTTGHEYGRSPDGGSSKRGFRDYQYQRGDTRKDIVAGLSFVGEMALASKTLRIGVAALVLTAIGEVSGGNAHIRDSLSKILIGEKQN